LVVLDVYDQTGRKVSTLINSELPSGTHQVDFSGSLLPEGLYFYQLKVGNSLTTRKMVLKK
jgi:serine protease AprX